MPRPIGVVPRPKTEGGLANPGGPERPGRVANPGRESGSMGGIPGITGVGIWGIGGGTL